MTSSDEKLVKSDSEYLIVAKGTLTYYLHFIFMLSLFASRRAPLLMSLISLAPVFYVAFQVSPLAAQSSPLIDETRLETDLVDQNGVNVITGDANISVPLASHVSTSGNPPLGVTFSFEKTHTFAYWDCGVQGSDRWIEYSFYRSLSIHGRNLGFMFFQDPPQITSPFGAFRLLRAAPGYRVSDQRNIAFGFGNESNFRIFSSSGAEIIFSQTVRYDAASGPISTNGAELEAILFPNGEKWTYIYEQASARRCGGGSSVFFSVPRLRYVISNRGIGLHFDYDHISSANLNSDDLDDWYNLTAVRKFSLTEHNCSGFSNYRCPSIIASQPDATLQYNQTDRKLTITNAEGEAIRIEIGQHDRVRNGYSIEPHLDGTPSLWSRHIKSIERVGFPGSKITYRTAIDGGTTYDGVVTDYDVIGALHGDGPENQRVGYVYEVERDSNIWEYHYDLQFDGTTPWSQRATQLQRINPEGNADRWTSNLEKAFSGHQDPLGRNTGVTIESLTWFPGTPETCDDLHGRCRWQRQLYRYNAFGHHETAFERDNMGRVKRKIVSPNGTSIGFPGGDITIESDAQVTSYGYIANCSLDPRNCYKPIWLTDPLGNRTDYEYSSVHGGVTRVRRPAVDGIRPEVRYSYDDRHAWLRNSSGGYSQAADPIWLLSSEYTCRSSAMLSNGDCAAGPTDKVVTTYEYEAGSSSKGSNVFRIGAAVIADGQTLRTCYSYDELGRRISETQPKANLASCS
ncbi:MAG: hypothetical protein AAF683_05785 [Pseudomonadota bacterium]